MKDVYTRTEKPDAKCYVPSRPASDYKVGETYDFLFWNRNKLERDETGRISDDQILNSFYIIEGVVTNIDEFLHVTFVDGFNKPIEIKYHVNRERDDFYLDTWKKLVEFTRNEEGTSQIA
ncbi:hypothetical protein [Aquibacillus sediminis]|uniref:hypothetical protein n=1 Tax=Aquibacillus sediminis TaxID=2574734 RepID=UPI0011093BA2|nr:hypothetical protein [Aquibacillus sediminis]